MLARTEQQLITFADRAQLMDDLIQVVRLTGEHVLSMPEENIRDTIEDMGHPFSTVDDQASNKMRWCIEQCPNLCHYMILEESKIPRGVIDTQEVQFPVIVCDGVEGSTNAKRGGAAHIKRPIFAGTSAVILESSLLSSVVASAFYDFASGKVFSSVRGEPGMFL